MSLKTNYQDAVWSGDRRVRITPDGGAAYEGTIRDITDYDTVGDAFGASDINATNAQVNANKDDIDLLKSQGANKHQEINWHGVTVRVDVFFDSFVVISAFGNVNQNVSTKSAWNTVADLSTLFELDHTVEGYTIINTQQTMRYIIGTDGILKFGQTQTTTSGASSSLSSGYAVKCQFAFAL